jgi:hypothetical protein
LAVRSFQASRAAARRFSRFLDRGEESVFIRPRRFVEAADFSHKLERCSADLFSVYRRLEIEKSFNVAAHRHDLGDSDSIRSVANALAQNPDHQTFSPS